MKNEKKVTRRSHGVDPYPKMNNSNGYLEVLRSFKLKTLVTGWLLPTFVSFCTKGFNKKIVCRDSMQDIRIRGIYSPNSRSQGFDILFLRGTISERAEGNERNQRKT